MHAMMRATLYCSSLLVLICSAKKSDSTWTNDEGHDGKYTSDKTKQIEGSTKAIASTLLEVADLSTRSLKQKVSPSATPTSQEGQVKGDFLFNPKPKPTSAPTRQPSTTPSRRPSSRPANSVSIISDGNEVSTSEGSLGKRSEGTKSEGKSEKKSDASESTTSEEGKVAGDFLLQPKPQPIPAPNIQPNLSLPSRQPSNRPISRSNIVSDGGEPDDKNDNERNVKGDGSNNKSGGKTGKEKSEGREKDDSQRTSANSFDSRDKMTSRGKSSVESADRIFFSSGSSMSVIVTTIAIGMTMALIGRV